MMKHPRTCGGCRALFQSQCSFRCDLGYDVEVRHLRKGKGIEILLPRPKNGKCPKPLTYDQLCEAPHAGKEDA